MIAAESPTRMSSPTPDPRPPETLASSPAAPAPPVAEATDLMILADGTIYARNLTPDLARILAALNPDDAAMALRAKPANPTGGSDSPSP